ISTRIFDHPAALRRFEIFSLGVLAYLCVIAILFLLDARALIFPGYIVGGTVGMHAERAAGPFLQAVANGMTINMLALIALDSFRRLRPRGALAMFFFVAVPIAVLATKTRAVWLGFAGSVIVLMFSSSKRVRYACLALIVAAALAVCSAITFGNPNNSIADRFEERSPVEFRIAMYRRGWEMCLEKPEFRGDELSIRERTTVHVRRDVGGAEPPAAGSSHSCSIGLLMASGLLTEQEPREGENSATSFEPHALFTPSAIRGGAYLSLR